jgi:hypothetical protein
MKLRLLTVSTTSVVLALSLLLLAGCQPPASEDAAESTEASQSESSAAGSGAGNQARESSQEAQSAPVPRVLTVPAGTVLKVRTTNTLSTKSVQAGETFTASLEEPLVADGQVVAAKGATVYGKVASADECGRVKGVASLSVRLSELQAANGERLSIATDIYGVQAQSTKKKDATKVGIASGVGAAIGAIAGGGSGAAKGAAVGAGAGGGWVLGTRGDAAEIPSESVLSFSLEEPLTIR